jgi:hypothetical protein
MNDERTGLWSRQMEQALSLWHSYFVNKWLISAFSDVSTLKGELKIY